MTDFGKGNMKHRGRNDIEEGGVCVDDDEGRSLLLLDNSENNSHSSKERKIQSTTASTTNSIKGVVAAIAVMVGLLFVLQGGASSFLGSSSTTPATTVPSTSPKKSSSKTTTTTNAMIPPISSSGVGGSTVSAVRRTLQVTTWNIAAINNNPFEYWITYPNEPAYETLMVRIEDMIENPGVRDIQVADGVFTQAMFERLNERLTTTAHWASMKKYWEDDYSKRKIVSEFLKDSSLGDKRLASMPDRVTNIINTANGESVFRPSVISMYSGDLSSQNVWWSAWEKFMFDTELEIRDPKSGITNKQAPFSLLQSIPKLKYQLITEQEEVDSLPLQTLCGAIFDAILVHMMNSLSDSPTVWQTLKRTMVENLNQKKVPHTLDILQSKHYIDSDIITLQEVSNAFVDMAKGTATLRDRFHIVTGSDADPVRDQNSVIFLAKTTFDVNSVAEITDEVKRNLASNNQKKIAVGNGDILAIAVSSTDGRDKYIIASFHGDTNGLQTIPVTDALYATVSSSPYRDHLFIFGLDANTYEGGEPGYKQGVMEYTQHFSQQGLTSCWGEPYTNPANYTTYNARTYLQTQLNKACKSTEKRANGDVNPKDFILFGKDRFRVLETWKDNTGQKSYIEDMAFPTLEFPSDHGLLATILQYKE